VIQPGGVASGYVAAGLLVAGLAFAPTPAQAKEPLAVFIDQLAQCTSARTMTLAVAGFANDEQSLSRAEADEARLAIETRLQAIGRLRLAPAADVVRINSLRQGTTGLTGAEAEQQIRNAFAGDASIFFAPAGRSDAGISFRLVAVTKNADCKATSEPVEVAVRRGAAIADIDKALGAATDRFIQGARDVAEVSVCPLSAPGGYSACSSALTDRVMLAIDAKARDPALVLRDRKLAVRRLPPGACAVEGDGVTVSGQFDHDRQGQSFMSVEFRRGGQVAALTGRTRISVEGLGCDPTLRPFLDHVSATAPANRGQLDVAAPPFAKGQRLEVKIEAKAGMRLYCWVLAPDESAYVLLPAAGGEAQATVKPGQHLYPSSFGLTEIVLQSAFENLFSCYGVEGQLPADLHTRWMRHAPGGTSQQLVPKDETLALMDAMRAAGAVEATARIVVR
jgi:hypothetical protein